MDNIYVLDCTLRDGGYCNNWKFGYTNIETVVKGVGDSGTDIIECGYLSEYIKEDKDCSMVNTLNSFNDLISKFEYDVLYVCMINYGDYDIKKLPDYQGKGIQGIRVAFHKKDAQDAVKYALKVKAKGYKVFLQPMVTLNYSDEEYIQLLEMSNEIEPYAFYIVDSFGVMNRRKLQQLFSVAHEKLKKDILLGFHAHNNMQLAYSNAQMLIDECSDRAVIIDASVMGMGRGAGNLNTELLLGYLNEEVNKNYNVEPLLDVIDQVISKYTEYGKWGYSLPNYLSALYNCHPNYASYLDNKKTLTIRDMNEIFKMIPIQKKNVFDKNFIEETYVKFLNHTVNNQNNYDVFGLNIKNKKILLIGPGKSINFESEKILAFMKRTDVISISINSCFSQYETDYIFISNLRRYNNIQDKLDDKKVIVTSNIPKNDMFLQVEYGELLNNTDYVRDNSCMMLIKLLLTFQPKEIYLAGIDGYSFNVEDNYAYEAMEINNQKEVLKAMNAGMSSMLKVYQKHIKIIFLTTPIHICIEDER